VVDGITLLWPRQRRTSDVGRDNTFGGCALGVELRLRRGVGCVGLGVESDDHAVIFAPPRHGHRA